MSKKAGMITNRELNISFPHILIQAINGEKSLMVDAKPLQHSSNTTQRVKSNFILMQVTPF